MAGRAQIKNKNRILNEAKEYYERIIATISDIEDGVSEREACDAHGLTLNKFRNDTLYRKRFGCKDKYTATKLYLSPYERIYGDVMNEQMDFISIQTLPVDLDSTIESAMRHTLTEKEIQLFNLYYFEDMTFTAVGKIMKLSVSRISQLHHVALKKLRQPSTKYRIAVGDAYIGKLNAERQEYWLHKMSKVREEYAAEIDASISELIEKQKAQDITALHRVADDVPTDVLDISIRAYVALRRNGITTIRELQQTIDSGRLLKLRGIGSTAADNITSALDRYFNP